MVSGLDMYTKAKYLKYREKEVVAFKVSDHSSKIGCGTPIAMLALCIQTRICSSAIIWLYAMFSMTSAISFVQKVSWLLVIGNAVY